MGNEEGEEEQAKGIQNIFNKIIIENFTNHKIVLPIQVQEASRTPNKYEQNRISLWHISLKQEAQRTEMNIESCKREKQITYKGRPIKITADFSSETLRVRRSWSEVFQALNENNFNSRILYPAKLSFKIERERKIFLNQRKLEQYTTSKPSL
jgi:hypothetical protein